MDGESVPLTLTEMDTLDEADLDWEEVNVDDNDDVTDEDQLAVLDKLMDVDPDVDRDKLLVTVPEVEAVVLAVVDALRDALTVRLMLTLPRFSALNHAANKSREAK